MNDILYILSILFLFIFFYSYEKYINNLSWDCVGGLMNIQNVKVCCCWWWWPVPSDVRGMPFSYARDSKIGIKRALCIILANNSLLSLGKFNAFFKITNPLFCRFVCALGISEINDVQFFFNFFLLFRWFCLFLSRHLSQVENDVLWNCCLHPEHVALKFVGFFCRNWTGSLIITVCAGVIETFSVIASLVKKNILFPFPVHLPPSPSLQYARTHVLGIVRQKNGIM